MQRPAGLVVVMALGGLAACTRGEATAPDSRAESGAGAHADAPSGDNGDLDNPVGAIRELSDVECAPRDGAWSATATLTNRGDAASTYLVKFSVVRTKTSTVQGSEQESFDLAAGETAEVDLPAFYEGDGKGLSCVPRVVKGDEG